MTEAAFYNALTLLQRSGYEKLADLKKRHGKWSEAWQNLKAATKTNINPQAEWEKLDKSGVKLVLLEDPDYPGKLKEIPLPPFGIYHRGPLPKNELIISIVGTRKATSEGKELAKNLASALTKSGFIIVSGLALGIDGAAHEGCLSSSGVTLAVLANGLDRFYPAQNEKLAKRILNEGGAIVSEYPLGTESLPYRFLERNRIVSGLSNGTLIVEAPINSGALTTARFALEQNREVFVVPGPVSHPNFKGSLQLIRSGATLVTCADEILEAFGLEIQPVEQKEGAVTAEEEIVLQALKLNLKPADVDKIKELTNLEIRDVNRTLSFLITKNLVKETEDGYTL